MVKLKRTARMRVPFNKPVSKLKKIQMRGKIIPILTPARIKVPKGKPFRTPRMRVDK